MTDYQPLKITFNLGAPVCLTHPWIFFDGVLSHLIQRKMDSHGFRALPSKKVVKVQGKQILPIKKTAGIYHASVSIFDTKDAYTTTIYKRFCEKYLDLNRMKKKKIDRGRGHFKDFMIRLVYIPAKTVTFYVCGIEEEIEQLLAGLPGLGKKTAIGFGWVKSFTIEEIEEDYSIVKDGKAMRPIPIPLVEATSDIALLAYKPPYWAKEFVAPCAPPGTWVKLGKNFRKDFKLGLALKEIRGA